MEDETGADQAAGALEAAVDEAVAACDGDLRGAVRALLVTLEAYEAELAALRREMGGLRAAISPGYVRGRLVRKGADREDL